MFAPHVLVPPTPGPLAAAANLELENLFLLILYGGILAFMLVMIGAAYAHYISRKTSFIMAKDSPKNIPNNAVLPSLNKAIAPIVVPIVLMALGTGIPFLLLQEIPFIYSAFILLCSPSIALGVGMLLAFRLLKTTEISLHEVVEKGLGLLHPF